MLDMDSVFGVRVVRDADPAAHAKHAGGRVGGEIVEDLEHARRAFAARSDAGRLEPVVLDEAERAELEARARPDERQRGGRAGDGRSRAGTTCGRGGGQRAAASVGGGADRRR